MDRGEHGGSLETSRIVSPWGSGLETNLGVICFKLKSASLK